MTREELIEGHMHLVAITARRAAGGLPAHIEREDLEGAGYTALVEAADRFNPELGATFSSYAITRIRGAMLEYLRRDDWVPRLERQRERAGEEAVILTVESLDTVEPAGTGVDENEIIAGIEASVLRRLVKYLPRRERQVIQRHVLGGRALRPLAEELGESYMTLCRLRDRALNRMRCWLDRTEAVSAN